MGALCEGDDSEEVYLVRGSVLSLSFPDQEKRNKPKKLDRPINQLDQIPATCREMLDCKTLLLPEILC